MSCIVKIYIICIFLGFLGFISSSCLIIVRYDWTWMMENHKWHSIIRFLCHSIFLSIIFEGVSECCLKRNDLTAHARTGILFGILSWVLSKQHSTTFNNILSLFLDLSISDLCHFLNSFLHFQGFVPHKRWKLINWNG